MVSRIGPTPCVSRGRSAGKFKYIVREVWKIPRQSEPKFGLKKANERLSEVDNQNVGHLEGTVCNREVVGEMVSKGRCGEQTSRRMILLGNLTTAFLDGKLLWPLVNGRYAVGGGSWWQSN
jgi:hypothetical protein